MHEKFNRNVQKSILLTETYTNILFLLKTKNGHILTFSEKMPICAILCFTTCDWFCPMTSHMLENVGCGHNITLIVSDLELTIILFSL